MAEQKTPASSSGPGDAPQQGLSPDHLEGLLAQAWITQAGESPHVQKFFAEIAPRLRLLKTSADTLQVFSKPDVTSDDVRAVFAANPYYESEFMKVVESMAKRENAPSVEAAVV